ncbi:uncharacterized protein LOC125224464 [Salvia hispanica]|uniref:uncharacterized protein LOC125224464 n=1 Tax=Salvia hispanica TaxID=49212 RepID=UPI002009A923|nr:uncharacterized protein LOC125224464 [Salvia hispanica]
MEEMREIVRSYYARESEADKKSIKQSFTEIDVNGDGNISLAEFKKAMSSTDGVVALFFFNKLDLNDDGCLDFDEFLCLYYIVNKKVPIPLCDGCREFPAGPYFSCLRCVGRGANSYDLCCSCYRSGAELSHEHSLEDMVDHHCIIKLFKDEKAKNKKEIEEIREIAIALHRGSSPEVQELATVFFQAMDSDGDGRVDLSEFLAFMTETAMAPSTSPRS